MILDKIKNTGDIKKIPKTEYEQLAEEIRQFLLEKTSVTGGHLASNLGVVELTMALHLSLNLPKDKLVFDVGHQCYTHKLLTGRKAGFDVLRQYNGMSGFPKGYESECDAFDTGHSSTAISAALGLAVARDMNKENNTIVAVLGDGALTGGMAYEALNHAGCRKTNFIVILNDNNISISPSVGGISRSLTRLRTSLTYNDIKTNVATGVSNIPRVGTGIYNTISNTKKTLKQAALKKGMFFEEMGFTYLGPFDGHNIPMLVEAILDAKKVKGPVIIHVITQKGRGYAPALEKTSKFHGVGPFDISTGEPIYPATGLDYTTAFGKKMVKLGYRYPKLVAITAAMADGTGLLDFSKSFPDRFFDVGIAEEHAVTFAAGLAKGGLKPVVAIYSSFLQRAYDQILHDVCLQDLPVVFAIDRSGITGPDGETHHGLYDLSYLTSIPKLTVFAPKCRTELLKILDFAMDYDHPLAIRYPKGDDDIEVSMACEKIELGKSELICKGSDVAILAIGSMVSTAIKVSEILKEYGISCSVINLRFAAPLDHDAIIASKDHKLLVVIEENEICGGVGEHILEVISSNNININTLLIGIRDGYVAQGTVSKLREECGLTPEAVVEKIKNKFEHL